MTYVITISLSKGEEYDKLLTENRRERSPLKITFAAVLKRFCRPATNLLGNIPNQETVGRELRPSIHFQSWPNATGAWKPFQFRMRPDTTLQIPDPMIYHWKTSDMYHGLHIKTSVLYVLHKINVNIKRLQNWTKFTSSVWMVFVGWKVVCCHPEKSSSSNFGIAC